MIVMSIPCVSQIRLRRCCRLQFGFIVDFEITWALVSLCERVRLYVTDAQANSLLCYKCKHIFRFYYNFLFLTRNLRVLARFATSPAKR